MKIINAAGKSIRNIYQYDSGIYIDVDNLTIDGYVHFTFTNTADDVLSVAITNRKAPIPNQLLIKSGTLFSYVYVVGDDSTKTIQKFEIPIIARPQPPEYVVDPTPVITYPELVDLVTAMQKWQNISASADTLEAGMPATALAEIGEDGVSFLFGIPGGMDGKPGKDGDPGTPGADGNGIISIEKTSSSGLVDTYTITFTNGTSTTFSVTNGNDGNPGLDGSEGLSMYINDTSTSTATTITDMLRSLIYVPDGRTLKVGDLILLTKNSNLYRVTGFPTDTTVSAVKVGTYEVPDGSITTAKIANGAVTNAKIADTTIDGAKLRDSAVYASKIASNAVTNAKINNSAVTSAKISAGAVTTAKIADEAVTSAKLDSALYSRIYEHTVLLWENSDVEAGMENDGEAVFNQTLNPVIYSQITVEFAITNTSLERVETTIPAETFGTTSGIVYRVSVDYSAFNSTAKPRGRQIKGLSTSKMTFSNGYEDGTVNSMRMVPTRIWGMR